MSRTITDRLGSGGMGNVYRAMGNSFQRYMALKTIRRGVQDANHTGRKLIPVALWTRVH